MPALELNPNAPHWSEADLDDLLRSYNEGDITDRDAAAFVPVLIAEIERITEAHRAVTALRWRAENRVQDSERRAVRAETKQRLAVAEVEILQEQVDYIEGQLADRDCAERARP